MNREYAAAIISTGDDAGPGPVAEPPAYWISAFDDMWNCRRPRQRPEHHRKEQSVVPNQRQRRFRKFSRPADLVAIYQAPHAVADRITGATP